eukprot:scaffold16460_cov36-Phaeocystis_antarctica.AAC.1
MGRSAPADFTGSQDRPRPANWAVHCPDHCGHAASREDCGEALISRPKLLRDTLLVLRHTVEALNLVFQF